MEESRHPRPPERRRCQFERGKGYSEYCIGISAEAEGSSACIKPFAEPLGNGLPHGEIVAEETLNATEVMMDEGRILLFSRDNSKEVLDLEVLVMLMARSTRVLANSFHDEDYREGWTAYRGRVEKPFSS